MRKAAKSEWSLDLLQLRRSLSAVAQAQPPAVALPLWQALRVPSPMAPERFQALMRRVLRDGGETLARLLLRQQFPTPPQTVAGRLLQAVGLAEFNDFTEARAHFEALVAAHPADQRVRIYFAQALRRHDEFAAAQEQLTHVHNPKALSLAEQAIWRDLHNQAKLAAALPAAIRQQEPEVPHAVLAHLVVQSRAFRPSVARTKTFLGQTAFLTGSLGRGGAERQFTRTVTGFASATQTPEALGGVPILAIPQVFVRSLSWRPAADFFLPSLTAAGVPVHDLSQLPGGRYEMPRSRENCETTPSYANLAPLLPHAVQRGMTMLAHRLRVLAPDVVSIWQDGAALQGALAALLAGVPRIIINLRSLPPEMRRELYRPAYAPLYRALAAEPNVHFVYNSQVGQSAYEAWIPAMAGRGTVIYNGVSLPDDQETPLKQQDWARFAAGFTPETRVIGTVIRFDDNKRPFAFVDVARKLITSNPALRFLMVGSGPLFEATQNYVRHSGLGEHVFLAGSSEAVGWWFSKMDLFLLLSHREGLPNAVIEAQMSGVPVAVTRAGGASEAIDPDRTGIVLDNPQELDIGYIAAQLDSLLSFPQRLNTMAAASRAFATAKFSMAAMLAQTAQLYLRGHE